MILTNYHTHTNFCDGKEEPETMVKEAIACGLSVLGFSGHSIYPFASDWHIPIDRIPAYVAEIRRLQEAYKDKIEILCGFEADYLPPISSAPQAPYRALGADYLIGSLHYLVRLQAALLWMTQQKTLRLELRPTSRGTERRLSRSILQPNGK